jgi:hypothetical protein
VSPKSLLSDESTCASAVLYSVEKLLGQGVLLWEPQSIWLELKHQGIDLPLSNREQLMAARNLLTTGRFWYDATVFEKTCTAFNNEEISPESVEDAPVVFISWAIWEANEIAKKYEILDSAVFDREPVAYMAVQLNRENFVVAPEELHVAQTSLNKYYPKETVKLQNTIHEAWAAAPRDNRLRDAAFPETQEGVQLARLATVQYYMNKQREGYLKDHAQLRQQ